MLSRLLVIAALAGGISYLASWSLPLAPAVATAWKGAGVGLLALYAASRAKNLDGWLLVAVMALGAAGRRAAGDLGPDHRGARLPRRPPGRHRALPAQPPAAPHRVPAHPRRPARPLGGRDRLEPAPRSRLSAWDRALCSGPLGHGGVRLPQAGSAAAWPLARCCSWSRTS